MRERFRERGQLGSWQDYVRKKLLPRLFGFELLVAPYVIAHLKLAMVLEETGFEFEPGDRLGVYLTNTLEEAAKRTERLGLDRWLTEESEAAAEIKRDKPIVVVLGNPPYSGHSANASWRLEQDPKEC